jgi:hypothetical protein
MGSQYWLRLDNPSSYSVEPAEESLARAIKVREWSFLSRVPG